jgi:hypothetical protein
MTEFESTFVELEEGALERVEGKRIEKSALGHKKEGSWEVTVTESPWDAYKAVITLPGGRQFGVKASTVEDFGRQLAKLVAFIAGEER